MESGPQERLHLWFRSAGTRSRLVGFFHRKAISFILQPGQAGIEVGLRETRIDALLVELHELLSPAELDETNVLRLRPRERLGPGDFQRVVSLRTAVAELERRWLRRLILEDRLTGYFQPIVSARHPSSVLGYEMLLRGHGEGRDEVISPTRLFQSAIQCDMLSEMDLAATNCVIRSARQHCVERLLFINCTSAALGDGLRLAGRLQEEFRGTVSPSDVVLELTELEGVRHTEKVVAQAAALRQFGFRLALDDLGVGHAELELLLRLRPEFVKLDLRLIQGVSQDPAQAALLEHLLQLAPVLGFQTVAEGVEQEDDLRWLQSHQVDFLQGFLIAQPAAQPPALLER